MRKELLLVSTILISANGSTLASEFDVEPRASGIEGKQRTALSAQDREAVKPLLKTVVVDLDKGFEEERVYAQLVGNTADGEYAKLQPLVQKHKAELIQLILDNALMDRGLITPAERKLEFDVEKIAQAAPLKIVVTSKGVFNQATTIAWLLRDIGQKTLPNKEKYLSFVREHEDDFVKLAEKRLTTDLLLPYEVITISEELTPSSSPVSLKSGLREGKATVQGAPQLPVVQQPALQLEQQQPTHLLPGTVKSQFKLDNLVLGEIVSTTGGGSSFKPRGPLKDIWDALNSRG